MEIRRALRLKEGDKVLFLMNKNGEITIGNASDKALHEAQQAFSGVAELLGNPSDEEIQSWVDEVRYGKVNAR
jgi:bifunctional DNA-binding transcriptional regulator/antitoxin component of YhaV-PrlF toxin-antitoxin module